MLQKVFYISRY